VLYTFSALNENDIDAGGSLQEGESFTMPAGFSHEIQVEDDDSHLSGDVDNISDDSTQSSEVYDDGGLVTSGTIYVDEIWTLEAPDGTTYTAYQIEIEGTAKDFVAFAAPPPPPGTVLTLMSSNATPDPVSYSSIHDENAPVCYVSGTLIDTPDGPRAIETLCPGDLVNTVDDGQQPVLWIHRGHQALEGTCSEKRPVLIQAGAFSKGCPSRDLIISPQHRILVGSQGQLGDLFCGERFAPAKALTSLPRIRHMRGKRQITWIHFALKRHSVVRANGCYSESLLLGPMVLKGLCRRERRALDEIFGIAVPKQVPLNGPPARETLTVGEVKRQIARHHKKEGSRVADEVRKWDRDLEMERYEAQQMREAS